MNTALKIAAFAAGVTTVFGAAYGVGHLTGDGTPAPRPAATVHTGHAPAPSASDPPAPAPAAPEASAAASARAPHSVAGSSAQGDPGHRR
ncbi:hypothetical protein ACFCX4_35350 [Kitasatospora sp. NPDC056327]|uniref:hypothetical protein n=1 Tax=Kitasatospora sp. NPDC056327 TaxID=3345785 RepID=UPI0035DAC997